MTIERVTSLLVPRLERLFEPPGLPLVEKRRGGPPSTSILVAGGPGTGKTTLATAFAVGVARARGGLAVYLTTESVPTELVHKARLLGIDEGAIRPWSSPETARPGDLLVHHLALAQEQSAHGGVEAAAMSEAWRLVQAEASLPIAALVIDVFGALGATETGGTDRSSAATLVQGLEGRGITPILVEEAFDVSRSSFLRFVVDLVFDLRFERDAGRRSYGRTLACAKSRYATAHVGPHDYGLELGRPAVWPDVLEAALVERGTIDSPRLVIPHVQGSFLVLEGGSIVVTTPGVVSRRFERAVDLTPAVETTDVSCGPLVQVTRGDQSVISLELDGVDAAGWTIRRALPRSGALVVVHRFGAVRDARMRERWWRVFESLRQLGACVWIRSMETQDDAAALADIVLGDRQERWLRSMEVQELRSGIRSAGSRFVDAAAIADGTPSTAEAERWRALSDIVRRAQADLDSGAEVDVELLSKSLEEGATDSLAGLRAQLCILLHRVGTSAVGRLETLSHGQEATRAGTAVAWAFAAIGEDWRAANQALARGADCEALERLWTALTALYAGSRPAVDALEEKALGGDRSALWPLLRALARMGAWDHADEVLRRFAEQESLPPWLALRLRSECRLEGQGPEANAEARSLLDRLLSSDPPRIERADVLHNLGLAEQRRGEEEKAASAFRSSLERNPRLADTLRILEELESRSR